MAATSTVYGGGFYDSAHDAGYTEEQIKRRNAQVAKHHQHGLPKSLAKVADQRFSLAQIKRALHFRLLQMTARDSTRYSEFMALLKRLGKRRDPTDEDQLKIYKEDFHTLLTELQVYASKEQADILFDWYDDLDGVHDGTMPIYAFIQRARDPDYGAKQFFVAEHDVPHKRTGPKLFVDTAVYGIPVEAKLPSMDVYELTVHRICKALSWKIEQLSATNSTLSLVRQRRRLTAAFEWYDNDPSGRRGFVSRQALWRLLISFNFPVEDEHLDMLIKRFPGAMPDTFRYSPFIRKVYPKPKEEEQTSFMMSRDKGAEYWAFMDAIDTDGDGTVSLEEMLAYRNSLGPMNTPPPMTPDSDVSDVHANFMARIADVSTRKAADAGKEFQPQPDARSSSRASHYSRPPTGGIPRVSRPPTGGNPSVSRPPTGGIPRVSRPPTGGSHHSQVMRVGTPMSRVGTPMPHPPATSRVSRPPSVAAREIISRGSHTARLSRSRAGSRTSRAGSRGGF